MIWDILNSISQAYNISSSNSEVIIDPKNKTIIVVNTLRSEVIQFRVNKVNTIINSSQIFLNLIIISVYNIHNISDILVIFMN